MSRSRKKTARSGDKKNKCIKKLANKRYRKIPFEEELNYSQYKKNSCKYDICDFEEIGISFEQYYQKVIKSWHRFGKLVNKPYPDRDKIYQQYIKYFIRK